jgi:hypothetical protein
LPFSIVGDSAGIKTWVGMAYSVAQRCKRAQRYISV